MSSKSRRVARLEQKVGPYLQRQKEEHQKAREGLAKITRAHAIALAALVLHGKPKLEEPLEAAWKRCCLRFGRLIDQPLWNIEFFEPVLKELPGDTEAEKFQHVFDIAPLWLLEFTHAIMTAGLLGLKCPDTSRAPRAGQTAYDMVLRWPLLPHGTLQAGGPVRPFNEKTLTMEERRELNEIVDELIEEAEIQIANEGIRSY
jgi:hypothetical protein